MNRRELLFAAAAAAGAGQSLLASPSRAAAPDKTIGDPADLTIAEAASVIRAGTLTATDLTSEYGPGVEPLFSIENMMIFNLVGLPALSVPCGLSKDGLPIGLTIAGPRFSEATLLALGAAYERRAEWRGRRPVGRDERNNPVE